MEFLILGDVILRDLRQRLVVGVFIPVTSDGDVGIGCGLREEPTFFFTYHDLVLPDAVRLGSPVVLEVVFPLVFTSVLISIRVITSNSRFIEERRGVDSAADAIKPHPAIASLGRPKVHTNHASSGEDGAPGGAWCGGCIMLEVSKSLGFLQCSTGDRPGIPVGARRVDETPAARQVSVRHRNC
jgi:hypothetical protein